MPSCYRWWMLRHRSSMALLVLLAGHAMGCGGDAVLEPDPSGAGTTVDVEVTLDGLRAVFCYCLHGCGPGISGHLAFTLSNRGPKSIEVGLQRLELVKHGSKLVDLDHPHPFNNVPFADLAAGASREYDFPLQ